MTLSVVLARAGQLSDEITLMPEMRTIHLTTGGSEFLVVAGGSCSSRLFPCIPAMADDLDQAEDESRAWVLWDR